MAGHEPSRLTVDNLNLPSSSRSSTSIALKVLTVLESVRELRLSKVQLNKILPQPNCGFWVSRRGGDFSVSVKSRFFFSKPRFVRFERVLPILSSDATIRNQKNKTLSRHCRFPEYGCPKMFVRASRYFSAAYFFRFGFTLSVF